MANPHGCYSCHLKTRPLNSLQALGRAVTCWFDLSSPFLHEGGGLGTPLFNNLAVELANIQWDDGQSKYVITSLLQHVLQAYYRRILDQTNLQGTGQGPVEEKTPNMACFPALKASQSNNQVSNPKTFYCSSRVLRRSETRRGESCHLLSSRLNTVQFTARYGWQFKHAPKWGQKSFIQTGFTVIPINKATHRRQARL